MALMPTPRPGGRHRPAFALIAVLFGLSVTAALVGAAAARMIGHAQDAATERTLTERLARGATLVDIAMGLGASELLDGPPLEIDLGGETVTPRLRDTGGLVDLNTAEALLVGAILAELGAPSGALARHEAWRRGDRYAGVADFARVTGVPPTQWAELEAVATVHSGQRGLSAEHAPPALRGLLERRGLWSAAAPTQRALPEALRGGPTHVTYRLHAGVGDRDVMVATLRLGGSVRGRRVLALH